MKSKYYSKYYPLFDTIYYSFRLENVRQRRPLIAATVRPSSTLNLRPQSCNIHNNRTTNLANSNTNNTNIPAESTLLDENGAPLIGHLLAFTPDVIQAFQDAAKFIEESREIKKQAMNQIKDAFNDAKAYSLTVNQSIAQKLADIITLAVKKFSF
jgi:hypothetical protein